MKQSRWAEMRDPAGTALASFSVVISGRSLNISNQLQQASELIADSVRELREKRGNLQQLPLAAPVVTCGRGEYSEFAKSTLEKPKEISRQGASRHQFGTSCHLAGENHCDVEMKRSLGNAAIRIPAASSMTDKGPRLAGAPASPLVHPVNPASSTPASRSSAPLARSIVSGAEEKVRGRCEIGSVSLQIAQLTEEIIKLRQARHGHASIIAKERVLVEKIAAQPKRSPACSIAVSEPAILKPVVKSSVKAPGFKEAELIHAFRNSASQNSGISMAETLKENSETYQKCSAPKRLKKPTTSRKPRTSFVPAILSRRDMTSVLFRLAALVLLIGAGEAIRRTVSNSTEQQLFATVGPKTPVSTNVSERNNHTPLIGDPSKGSLSMVQSVGLASNPQNTAVSGPKKDEDEWKRAFSRQLEHPEGSSFEAALNAGVPRALFDKAIYFAESGDDASFAEAALLFSQAAEKEFIPAQFRLGLAFEKGLGVPKNMAKAASLYSRAALGGNIKAMHNLATLFASGFPGSKPDYTQAAHWFRSAAERGFADSQYNYALLALKGVGMPRSPSEAFKYMSLAAMQGDADAVARRDQIAQLLNEAETERLERDISAFNVTVESAEANEKTLAPSPWLENDWVTQRWFKKSDRQG